MTGPKMLRISGFYDNSCTNGEGWRSVIFFSGCPHRCRGCQNPDTWDYSFGEDISVNELTEKVLENLPMIDGVTLSGGEPFQEKNIGEMIVLADKLKQKNLNIWCYSGYEYEYLKSHPLFSLLLSKIDVLIDGKYEQDLFDHSLKFKGSSNQRVIDVKQSLINDEAVLVPELTAALAR